MKKVFLFLSAALAMMAIASCDKDEEKEQNEPEKNVTVEINAANLQGTWEGAVEHDFGQGYPQKWRLQIDGENYKNCLHILFLFIKCSVFFCTSLLAICSGIVLLSDED